MDRMKTTAQSLPSQHTEPSTPAGLSIDRSGRIHFWLGGSIWVGRSHGRTDWHDHHALQIAVALDGVCSFRSRVDGDWCEFTAALVQSHRHHQFESRGVTVAQLFVEPETAQGRALLLRFEGADIVRLSEAEYSAMTKLLVPACGLGAESAAIIHAARAAVAVLTDAAASHGVVDARIQKAIEYVRTHVRDGVTMTEVAKVAALSPSRFRHLFLEQTGSAFRVYVLWMRLNVAVEAAVAGKSWTDAAHQAGFTDSAHLTRTFKRMFGINPASLTLDMRTKK
jgi:AraC family transcriptional regulator